MPRGGRNVATGRAFTPKFLRATGHAFGVLRGLPLAPRRRAGKLGSMERKIDLLRAAIAARDVRGALRIAARFHVLGDAREVVTRGWEALARPDFYRQIGRDPDALVAAGWAAVVARYSPKGAKAASSSGPSAS